jgi:3-phosphoshikimate 1-carboxyvinyltransferase
MDYKIFPPEDIIETEVTLPLSKSESNRQLIINALTPGAEPLERVALCDDTDALRHGLQLASADNNINVGAAGTAMRFLTAYLAVQPGHTYLLDGSERMRRRPIGPLVEALRQLGAEIEYAGEEGFPPLKITGRRIDGGAVEMAASVSSQFVSALLMVAPTMSRGLELHLQGTIASRPYIDMTLQLMTQAGADARWSGEETIVVAPTPYSRAMAPVEADWSAASYWLEIAAIGSAWVTLHGLHQRSLQGDSRVVELFAPSGLGCVWQEDGSLELQPTPDAGARLHADFSEMPDLAQTMAVACCLLSIPFEFSGLRSLRIKETDRLTALRTELMKFGYLVESDGEDTLWWHGAAYNPDFEADGMPRVATYDDHRMALAFAPAALYFPGMTVCNAEVVSKSYPDFWDDMRRAGFTLEEVEA